MTAPEKKFPYAFWIIIGCCALMTSSVSIPLNCAGLFYAPVSKELGVGIGPLSIYLTIQCACIAVCLPLAGKLLSTHDVRIIFSSAVLLYAVSFGAMGFYHALYQFYISGVLLGIAGALTFYLAVPLLVNNWFKKRAGTAMGVAYAFIGIGALIFSPITGYAITNFGWRTSYIFLGVMIAVVSLPFTLFVIRAKPSDLGLKAYGEEEVSASTQVAVADDWGLTKAEAFKTPQFYVVFVFAGLLGLAAAFMYHVPTYIVNLGFSSTVASTVVAVGTIGITGGKLGIGYLIDKIGILRAGVLGITVGFAGIIVLAVLGHFGLPFLMAGTALFGVSYACTVLEPPHVVKTIFGNKDYAGIYSSIMVCSSFGTAFGASILGFMRDATGTYASSLVVVMAMYIIAAVLLVAAMLTGKKIQAKILANV
ncbi:MFS transporter [Telmatospirillum sp.]|uniref:MFS transporter n=1 Tax=Telmatospirillum sp. TaxID=2079197 RepID=UPI00284CADA4|nr:MFS transporter [Telmatospirillum sp.]MDR3439333.1 MFS transporter [Telmatospirillum sp.]